MTLAVTLGLNLNSGLYSVIYSVISLKNTDVSQQRSFNIHQHTNVRTRKLTATNMLVTMITRKARRKQL